MPDPAAPCRGETPRRFKVSIGETHSCSCRSGNELCIHILFVLMRVFRMPAANPLIWQLSLTEREIAELMRGRVNVHTRPPPRAAPASESAGASEETSVERKELGEDPCPICYDDMSEGQQITYCKSACGNNVHTKCMKMWADNRIANGEEVTCPMCRTGWGVPDWLGTNGVRTRRERFDGLAVHHGISCRGCSTINFAGTRYKCMICNNYDLCSECFTASSAHRQHPFVSRDGIDSEWVAADRSDVSDASAHGDPAPSGSSGTSNATPGTGVVSVDLLTKLPTKPVTEDECGRGSSSCGVCGDAFRPGQVARTIPCGCRYHQRCIDRRLMEQMDVCPNGVAGRGAEACMIPITAETVQVQLETARALAVAASRRRENGGNRRRRTPAQQGVRADANGALDFSLGGISITTGGSDPEPIASAPEESTVLQGSSEGLSAAELRRKRAALAALERQRVALQAQHDAASTEESHLAGELGELLASQPMLGVTGASSSGSASTILGSASPVDTAVAAEAERRNQQAGRRGRLAGGYPSRSSHGRTQRPATVGEGQNTERGADLAVGSGVLLRHSSSTESGAPPDLVVGTARSSTAPIPSASDAGSARTAGRERGSRCRGRSGRREGATLGRRGTTGHSGRQRQPMDPTSTRSRCGMVEAESASPTVGWQNMFIGTAAPESPSVDDHVATSATVADLGTSGTRCDVPPASRRRGGRLLPRGSLRAARSDLVADGPSQSPRGSAGAGQAATAATLAEAQDAAQQREAEVIAQAERRREAAAAEARAARLARDQRRRAALARAAENQAAEAQREEARAEAKRQAQARIAARATAHREEQMAAEAARRSAREAALEARSAQAAW